MNEYSKDDFIQLVEDIINNSGSDSHQDELLERFINLSEHPAGSDLIYYPDSEVDATPKAIAEKVNEWRLANGKQGFKDS